MLVVTDFEHFTFYSLFFSCFAPFCALYRSDDRRYDRDRGYPRRDEYPPRGGGGYDRGPPRSRGYGQGWDFDRERDGGGGGGRDRYRDDRCGQPADDT